MKIKSFTKFFNFALVLLLISIGGLVFHSLSIREDINQSERKRLEAILLADELLQTSDDLTRMARTYVTTGESSYKHYFNVILDIRNGKRPRPLNYSASYWHLVSAGKIPFVEAGETIFFLERVRRAGFSNEDYALLQKSMANSDRLVHLERQAFVAIEGRYDDEKGNFTVRSRPDREFALGLLFGKRYIAEKAPIMEPIQEFRDLFNARMKTESDVGLAHLTRLSTFEIVLRPIERSRRTPRIACNPHSLETRDCASRSWENRHARGASPRDPEDGHKQFGPHPAIWGVRLD